jgi:transglutaminase-like putative cysteine protease
MSRIASDTAAARRVASEVVFRVEQPVTVVLQVAPARVAAVEQERFSITMDGSGVGPPTEITSGMGRAHVVRVQAEGRLVLTYDAVVTPEDLPAARQAELDPEVLVALRQSRYCQSDLLFGFTRAELHGATGTDVAAWVHQRLHYDIWSTHPFGTALETLTTGAGVCRDFAHLTIALCRAAGIPARLVSVYAPGLSPMDFHAVVEVHEEGRWHIVDPTRMAPRQSLVRIATGRDASDTAFVDTIAGTAIFEQVVVTATIDGRLPFDDHTTPVVLA